MRKFTWGIFYSSAKYRSADIVLGTLEAVSETWVFYFSSSTFMMSMLHYFENISFLGMWRGF